MAEGHAPGRRADPSNSYTAEGRSDGFAEPIGDVDSPNEPDSDEFLVTAATVAVVGVGVAIFEAALLPGLILGVAATLAPKYLPGVGEALSPLFKATVRGAYKFGEKAVELAAEAQEQFHDVVAEVKAEGAAKADAGDNRERAGAAPMA